MDPPGRRVLGAHLRQLVRAARVHADRDTDRALPVRFDFQVTAAGFADFGVGVLQRGAGSFNVPAGHLGARRAAK